MPRKAFKDMSKVAQFISRRIDELRPRRSQTEIATAAGLPSVNFLSMIKDGKAKLPMDRVVTLANALECEPAALARLALEQFFAGPTLDVILSLSKGAEKSINANSVFATALALRVQVQLELHDVKFCSQFLRSATSRIGKVEASLQVVAKALDELVIESS
jgi:hypothetical protein